jgi:hypothetical protein
MFRFVDNLKVLFALSCAISLLSFLAMLFLGAPAVLLFYATCGLLAFTSFANWWNARERRRHR